ncbi:uncharacterized protein LOC128990457 [Macrosteles quadrilineatus]|uniref:uncharacterized protein LOC128990457 n=1 Tax=Macrosteles quadrilineatus TaxID=74068 RepID=UPI0023E2F052|nr:uncharacterized protein LOC128990457 [Macrosteles quadrilineatus]XP_054268798.1 uncharacterized protein LOC128990457 [Macrosteles quadrilineatus]
MRVTNTYSRKNSRKKRRNRGGNSPNNVNINLIFLSVNITNNSSQENNAKPETSQSQSGDLFDKLVKGPIYNVNNKSNSRFSVSDYNKPFFNRRQETITHYKSDDALSISTDVSNHLFKDSKDSQNISPMWMTSPPPYCKIKNKLVKIEKDPKLTVSKKSYNRVMKKRPLLRKNKPFTKLNSDDSIKSSCTSSTPTRTDVAFDRDIWVASHVSPILPTQGLQPSIFTSRAICYKNMVSIEEIKKEEKPNPMLGFSALLEGFGNLGIQSPHHKKLAVLQADKKSNQELFDYESPLRLPANCQSRETNPESITSNVELLPVDVGRNSNVCKSLQSSEDNSNDSSISTTCQKKCNEENSKEFASDLSSSPFLGFDNNSNESQTSAVSSPQSEAVTNPDHSSSNEQRLSSNKILPSIFIEELKSDHEEQTDSKNTISSSSKVSSASRSEESNSISLAESLEKSGNSDVVNSSSTIPEHISEQQQYLESKDDLTEIEENEVENESVSNESFEEKQAFESKPLSDITNSLSLKADCANGRETLKKKSVPFSTESKRTSHYSLRGRLSSYPPNTELNETFAKLSLEAGKRWRRSLLRQRQEPRLNKRESLTSETIFRLIRESSFASGLNITKMSYNNTTRILDSFLEEQETKDCGPVSKGSPGLNLTHSRLSNVYMNRRRNYVFDMNDIPEEIAEHSNDSVEHLQNLNVTQNHQDTVAEEDENCETSVNQTNVFETPPILRLNPEALSTITNRKRSRRNLQKSLERSILWDEEEEKEPVDEEDNFYMSCLSVLDLEDEIENLKNQDAAAIGKVGFLLQCGQQAPITFSEAFPDEVLSSGRKIGEGVFGEVFMLERPGEGRSVIKIIPIEGAQMVNGSVQKRYDEVLSELIITEELSMLRNNSDNCTGGFCELKGKFYLQGQYSPLLLKLWHEFDKEKRSENECPDMFGPEQLYLALELAHAGEPVESFSFKNLQQALIVFLQTTFSLAVAETAADFEHRDLHIGNVLVQPTSEKYVSYVLNGQRFECPTFETMVTIIDYTLSRISFREDVLYLDLEQDPELFTATGDYQFEIYREMRADLKQNWRSHKPKTNIRWLHYLIDKFTSRIKYKQKKNTKVFRDCMDKMLRLREMVLDFESATDLAFHLIYFHCQTSSLIRTE